MSIAEILNTIAAQMPTDHPTVYGPPFSVAPAAPCYVVGMPTVSEVLGTGAACQVTQATVDVVCVPQTGTDFVGLRSMADTVIAAFGPAVTAGQDEPSPFTDVDDVWTYRLTVEV